MRMTPFIKTGSNISSGLKVSSEGKLETYGAVCREKDIIGVLLEFQNDGKGRISFYRNGVSNFPIFSLFV